MLHCKGPESTLSGNPAINLYMSALGEFPVGLMLSGELDFRLAKMFRNSPESS